jgi:multicomponent Na+:H+ antiporter subunit B
MSLTRGASLLFLLGLGVLLAAALQAVDFGATPMPVGAAILDRAVAETGATNVISAVLLAYRGLDTLGELTILFVAATAAGLVLQANTAERDDPPPAGLVLRAGVDLLFPFLLLLGIYIVLHGHLTPGGGFQGGAVLAVAFFLPQLARPAARHHPVAMAIVEGLAGAAFIVIGLAALLAGQSFLAPLLGAGEPGRLLSAGTLPLLYVAVGLKVGAELGGLLGQLLHGEAST